MTKNIFDGLEHLTAGKTPDEAIAALDQRCKELVEYGRYWKASYDDLYDMTLGKEKELIEKMAGDDRYYNSPIFGKGRKPSPEELAELHLSILAHPVQAFQYLNRLLNDRGMMLKFDTVSTSEEKIQ